MDTTKLWEQLQAIVARLRVECPWDREQTLESMRSFVLEECWEVIETINRCDLFALQEELGDMLLNMLLLCDIAQQKNAGMNKTGQADKDREVSCSVGLSAKKHFLAHFLDGLLERLCEKLVRRHPHVFGTDTADNTDEAIAHWLKAKKASKQTHSLLDSVKMDQSALLYTLKLQKKAAKAGFDWPKETAKQEIRTKIAEELAEFFHECENAQCEPQTSKGMEEELGDLLFSAVNLARVYAIDPELALGRSAEKFRRRFAHMEQNVACQNKAPTATLQDCSMQELEALWQQAKAALN